MLNKDTIFYKILMWIRDLSFLFFIIGVIVNVIYYTDVKMELTKNKEELYHVMLEESLTDTTKAIESNMKLDWYETNTISIQMTYALKGLQLANKQATEMLTFNKEDLQTLKELEELLSTYPLNNYDSLVEIDELDKKRYEQLAKNLNASNYGLRKEEDYLRNWDEFMKRANTLLKLEKENNSPELYIKEEVENTEDKKDKE